MATLKTLWTSSSFFRRGSWIAAFLIAIIGMVLFVPFKSISTSFGGVPTASQPDLSRPDVMIKTKSLAMLPRDLLKVPVFKDVLTEEFVFYYEQNEGRLGLSGTLRRIAYEHDLDLGDWVIKTVVDEPADVLFWKGPNGRLEHYLVAMSRNYLAKLLEMAAKVVVNDKQLQKIETNLFVDGKKIPVYGLDYAYNRTLYFAALADRMIILSDADLFMDKDHKISGTAGEMLAALLSKEKKSQQIYRDKFNLIDDDSEHVIIASARYLSFGYQRFFPSVQAIRFDFGKGGWLTQVMLDPEKLPVRGFKPTPFWNMVPADAAYCVALPVDWSSATSLIEKVAPKDTTSKTVAEALGDVAGVCWYPKSNLHTPLVAVPTKRVLTDGETKLVEKIFETTIGANEPGLKSEGYKRYPVKTSVHGKNIRLLQREATSKYGIYKPEDKTEGPKINDNFFLVTLTLGPQGILFSADDKLVGEALVVADKKSPAMGDALSGKGDVMAIIRPTSLGQLLWTETLSSLSAENEPELLNVAKARLLPRLSTLKKYPHYSLALPAGLKPAVNRWLPVVWQTNQKP